MKLKKVFCTALSLSSCSVLLYSSLFSASAIADDAKARAIMEKVDARDDGDNQISDMEMILIDKRGKQRVRKIHSLSKDIGEDSYRIMFFQEPADVRNTGFLTYDYDDASKDDDQWLYLPALKKSKRISTSDKSGSFMGSDFSYSDMTSRDLGDYDFTFKKEMEVNGVKVWVIESVPRTEDVIKETGSTKGMVFVRQDNYVAIRSISWLKKGKKLKYMDMKGLELIDGIWTPTEIHMTTKSGKITEHKSILKFTNIKFNQPLDKDKFSVRRLEKGL
ncbi:MAG: outer membrane lipoprotein-sorting protein [Gammaproteobacteria bacterium]|nr:outer membrane lipoprotein-sorting protein [Gammaproteobacteria bacterium]